MSSLTLIIGNKNYSSWSLRPWILMRHHELDFAEERHVLFTDTIRDELEAYGSDYKVPILVDDETIVWDSLAILEYISEQHLAGKGWPADANARALARSISAEMHSSFANVRGEMPMNCRKFFPEYKISDKAETEVNRIKALWQRCRDEFGQSGPWLFGEFCIADAMYAPIVMRFISYDVPVEGDIKAYMETVSSHPGIQEWVAAGRAEKEVLFEDEV